MQIRCPQCRVPFESEEDFSWSDLSCPSCGVSFSLSGDETTHTYTPGFEVLGRFVLLEMVGAGRFGSVWKAHDTQLQRNVAVKIPRQRELDPHETELFLRDARAAAQLKHPRIASVHEVGRQNETVYIVTDFIDGANLHEWLSCRRLSAREAAELMIKIAEAVNHAHEAGVVHRDLKPSNIMMDSKGEPHVIDFGLARREVGEMTVTMDGQVLGTPAYMSPEQARGEGHRADGRSDTYSLGVILFKLLTGELPFRGQTRMLIMQILDQDPPNPRQLDANVPRDLATITLKCLEKGPEKRYQTAREFADDLKRYLAGEPIKARPVGGVERAWRWCKRHPEVASLSALLLLTLTAVSIVAPLVAVYQAQLRRESELRRIDLQRQVASNYFQRAGEEYNAGRVLEGIALLAGAYEIGGAEYPLSSSIRRLMTGWSGEGGQPILFDGTVLAAAFNPDGRSILIGGHNSKAPAQLWDTQTVNPIGETLEHAGAVRAVAFSPDGQLALTGSEDGSARLWDIRTGRQVGRPLLHSRDQSVWAVAFSPDGNSLVTGLKDKTDGGKNHSAQLWNVKSGVPLGEPWPYDSGVFAVAFRPPDGQFVVTGGVEGAIRTWDVRSPPYVETNIKLNLNSNVYALAFNPDGNKLLVGNGGAESIHNCARLLDAETLESIAEPLQHDDLVYAVAFSPDGRTALTGSFDNTARLWDVATCRPIGEPMRHGGWVMSVAFSPDGRTALTGGADRTARLWNLSDGRILHHETNNVGPVAFSPNGGVVITGGDDGTARLWDARTGKPFGASMRHDGPVVAVALSPDGRIVLTGSDDHRVRLWDAQTGKSLKESWELSDAVRGIQIGTDGKSVIIHCGKKVVDSVQLRDLVSGNPLCDPLRFDASEAVIAASPDGRTVLTQGSDRANRGVARLWDVPSGRPRGEPLVHKVRIMAAAFSSDGRHVVTGVYNQEVCVWDSQTGKAVGNPFGHDGVVNDVVFGRDGTTILSASDDRKARLWDIQSGKARGQPLQHSSKVATVALGPDGRLALTISSVGSAQLWDALGCKPLARPLEHELSRDDPTSDVGGAAGPVKCIDGVFNADGSAILFTCSDGTARLYDVPQPLPDDPALICAWARARSGHELDENGVPQQLSQSNWLEAKRELASLQDHR